MAAPVAAGRRSSSPSSAPGVLRARRFAIRGLAGAALVAGILALIFTAGKQGHIHNRTAGTENGGQAPGGKGGALVTPLLAPDDGQAVPAAAAAAAAAGGTIDAAASTSSSHTAASTFSGSAQTQPLPPASGDGGLLQKAAAKNPLLSTAGDPLQLLSKQHQHQHQAGTGTMHHEGMDMGNDDDDMDVLSEVKAYLGESTCLVADIDELQDAVENGACPLVMLTSPEKDAYALMGMNEIAVTRRVRVMGHPAMLPTIDAMMGMRAFRVQAGGFLELQHVRVRQSMGMYRRRYGLEEGAEGQGTQVLEIKGGSVMLEPGAEGATFIGVVFLMLMTDAEMVQMVLEDQANLNGWRIYGGHVYVAAGSVSFLGCHFWDSMLVMPLTDVLGVGGDVLVVAGSVFFTGCTFTTTMLLCNYASAGWNVAVLGGTAVVTFTVFQWQSLAMSMQVAGMVLFVGGGVAVLTGVDFRFVSALMSFMGMGSFATGAGALVLTGVTQEQVFACFAAFGAGMFNAVGSGVMAEQGATYLMYSGPAYQSMTGAVSFVGTGSSTHIGVPASMYGSTGSFSGQGGFSYNGAGVSVWVGCPLAMFWATYAFFGLGGVASHGAGTMVWVGNPVFMPMAISYFAGLGSVMFVGGGSAVLVGSPVAMPMALMAWSGPSMNVKTDDLMNPESTFGMMNHTSMELGNLTMDHAAMQAPAMFWVQGNTESDGQGASYVTGAGAVARYPHPKWASHLLDSDPEFNLFEHGMTNRSASFYAAAARRAQGPGPAAPLSAASLVGALALFGSDPVGTPRLLAMGLDADPSVDLRRAEVDERFRGWVPGPMLEAAKEVAALREKLAAAAAGEEEEEAEAPASDTTLLRVENGLLDCCGVCETEGAVDGSGVEVCDVEVSCQALQARAPLAAQPLFDYDRIAFSPQALVVAEFRPTTAAGQTLDAKAFQRALEGYLKAKGTTGVMVTAFPALPSPGDYAFLPQEASEQQRALWASSLANDEFPLTHPIRAVFVTPEPHKAAELAAALRDHGSDAYVDMELFVGDALASEAGVLVQALDGAVAQTLAVPAYRSPELTRAFAEQLDAATGSNAVRLLDPDNAGVPLTRAVTGRRYMVQLARFPPNAKLTVQLLGQKEGRQTAASVMPLVAADATGAASFTWTVPAAQPTGDYTLKATTVTGKVFGFSPVFTVDTKLRRRLFGPSHEFHD